MIDNQNINSSDEPTQMNGSNTKWEREVLEKLVMSTLDEQRKARKWGIFFKVFFLTYLVVLLGIGMSPLSSESFSDSEKHTAVVDVIGMIAEGANTNAAQIIEGLNAAAKHEGTQGIILRMNTPGGSPVQSSYVYNTIRRIKKDNPDLPIYAVVSDMCASGGYFIASAADKIFVNPSSIIGSIGVMMNGFGFVDTMDKLGIERRLMIAGDHKGILDPFTPVNAEEKNHLQGMLDEVHQQFISAVRKGRGDRLAKDPSLFSGLVWTGEKSIGMGLADDFGSVNSVANDVIGEKNVVNFTPMEGLLDKLTGKIGIAIENALLKSTVHWRIHF